MRRRTAYLLCVVVFLAVLVLDVLVLTDSRVLGRIAAQQLQKHAGDTLKFDELTLSVGGRLRLEGVRIQPPKLSQPILTAPRVRVDVGYRDGGVVAETVVLDEPRIRFSDKLLKEMEGAKDEPRRPISHLVHARLLPRITCKGGTLEISLSEALASSEPQILRIRELVLVPTTGYRYFVRGSVRSDLVGEWSVQGELDLESGDHRVHLVNEKLTLNSSLRDALAPGIREAWDKYSPSGPAGAEVLLERDSSAPETPPPFRLRLKPRGLSIRYKNFNYPCDQIVGEMEFRADGFTVKHIEAMNGRTTKIRFSGSADGYESDAGYHFILEMDDVAFDDTLKGALEKEAQEVWALFKPSGRLNARVTVHRDRGPDHKEILPVELHLKGASLTYAGFPYSVDRVVGEVRILGDDVDIRRIAGEHGKAAISVSGRIQSISKDSRIDIDVRATSMALDGRLRDALAPETRQIFDRVGASGDVDVEARVLREPGGEPKVFATLRPKGNRVLFRDVQIPVLIREGTVEINDGHVRIHHLKGQADPGGELEVSGEIAPVEGGTSTNLRIDGLGIAIDDRFRDRMPKGLGEVLRSLKLGGVADFKFTLIERPERDKPSTRVRLQLDLRKGSTEGAVPFEEIEGTVVLVGPIQDGRPTLTGRLDIRSARVFKQLVRNLTTNVTIQGPRLDFRDIAADAYGGKLAGWVSLDTVTSDLEGDFSVSQLELREFINDTATWTGKTIAGKVNLRIPALTGKADNPATLVSKGGSMSITEGQLLDVPGIITFLNPLGMGGQFTAMKAFFDIEKQKFDIKEFVFLGKEGSGSIIGKGRFNFDGEFSLKVRTETASLFGIDFFLTKIPGQLLDLLKSPFQFSVKGTLEKSDLLKE